MKPIASQTAVRSFFAYLFTSLLMIASPGCFKERDFPLSDYKQVNLVANTSGYGASVIDKNLLNAWGIAIAPSGAFWVASNHGSVSTVYSRIGATLLPPVTIPSHGKPGNGAPTGVVFNPSSDFVIPSTGAVSKFIFAGEDGVISAWSGGPSAILVADRSGSGAVYKGLAMGSANGENFLYAANFHEGKVDVFDEHFTYVTSMPFKDPAIPAHFAPFNIRNIKGNLFVSYAMQKAPDNMDDQAGAGNGFIDIYNTRGILLKRFASHGALNSPWGMVASVQAFHNIPDALLVGNFGDGRINVFERSGEYEGQLQMNGKPVTIEGLWALENNVPGADPKQLFFTAGPAGENDGLFGYLEKK